MLLSVIIVSFNTKELTLKSIESVIADCVASQKLRQQTEIIVVDNHSHDDSVSAIKSLAQRKSIPITVIANDDNLGFAAANNKAIAQSQGQYLLLLNSDTEVQPGALEKLLAAFEQHPIDSTTAELQSAHGEIDRLGIVAATLLNPDGSLQPQGGSFPTLLSLAVHMLMLDDIPLIGQWLPSTQHTGKNAHAYAPEAVLVPQDWVGGTAMMIRREVIAEIDALDEHIFMYAEDVEFCLRAQQHHWDVAIAPQARIIHLGSASSTSANAITGEFKGYLYIWSKHKPLWQMPVVKTLLRLGCLCRQFVFGTMIKNPAKAEIYSNVLHQIV